MSHDVEKYEPILEEIADTIGPLAHKVEQNKDSSLLVMATKFLDEKNPEHGVQTFTQIVGNFNVIAEGLYAELADDIESGNPTLFFLLSQVIHDLEEDFDINVTEDENERITATQH